MDLNNRDEELEQRAISRLYPGTMIVQDIKLVQSTTYTGRTFSVDMDFSKLNSSLYWKMTRTRLQNDNLNIVKHACMSEESDVASNQDQQSHQTEESIYSGITSSYYLTKVQPNVAGDIIYLSEKISRSLEIYETTQLCHYANAKTVIVDWGCFKRVDRMKDTISLLHGFLDHIENLVLVIPTRNSYKAIQSREVLETGSEIDGDDDSDNQTNIDSVFSTPSSSKSHCPDSDNESLSDQGNAHRYKVNIYRGVINGNGEPITTFPTDLELLRYEDETVHWSTIGLAIHKVYKDDAFWEELNRSYAMNQIEQLPIRPKLPKITLRGLLVADSKDKRTRVPRDDWKLKVRLQPSQTIIDQLENPSDK